jgi:hypothetical protein
MLAVPALVAAFDGQPLRVAGWGRLVEGETGTGAGLLAPRRKLAFLATVFLALGVVAILVVWAAYGFHSPLAVDAEVNRSLFDWNTVEPKGGPARALFALLRGTGLLPEAWTWGFFHFMAHTEGRPAFLFGSYSESGFPTFFLASFLIKTPLPLLALFFIGLATARRTAAGARVEWLVFFPLAFFFALSLLQSINIGHRHLLPVYPFVLMIAARSAALAFGPKARGRALAAAVGALALLQAVAAGRAFPHYLAYFNELVGGPRNGWRCLVDSSLDWGQELPGLRAWMRQNAVAEVKLAYFGTADVKYYGVVGPRLPGYQPAPPSATVRRVERGDVIAVSATLLQGVYLEPEMRPLMERLRSERPIEVIGHSLFVYRAGFTWAAPAPPTGEAEPATDAP